ncbi:hypothetical protein V1279_003649 [Bradyrhizobium sp. AZCC 1610]
MLLTAAGFGRGVGPLVLIPACVPAARIDVGQTPLCDLYHGCLGENPAKIRPNETILPKPRNHPETHAAYFYGQHRTSKASRRHHMNHSIHSADRSTHLKIVVVALVAGIAVAAFGISARTGSDYSQTAQVVKAGKAVVVTSANTSTVR